MGWLKRSAIGGTIVAVGLSATLLGQAAVGQEQKDKVKEKTLPRKDVQVRVLDGVRGWLGSGPRIGVSLRDVDEAAARDRKLPSAEGAVVEDVEENSPAAKAGVKDGDVITAFDGERVRSVRQLQRLVQETPVGRAVKLTILRDGKRTDLDVTPEERDGPAALARLGPGFDAEIRRGVEEGLWNMPREFRFEGPGVYRFERRDPEEQPEGQEKREGEMFRIEPRWPMLQWFGGAGRLGATVQDLTPQLGEYFGAKDGVLVSNVNPDTPASRAGLKAGDIIVSVNGKDASSAQELVRALAGIDDGAEVQLGIMRDRKPQTLKVKLQEGVKRIWRS